MKYLFPFLLLVIWTQTFSQEQKHLAIFIIGNMKGEKVKMLSDNQVICRFAGEDSTFSPYGAYHRSDEVLLSFTHSLRIMLKRRWAFRYKFMDVKIPDGLKEFLIIKRDRTLPRNVGFSAHWSDTNIYVRKKQPVFGETPVTSLLEKPSLSVLSMGKVLDSAEVRKQGIASTRYAVLELRLDKPPALPDSVGDDVYLLIEEAQIIHAHGDVPIGRTLYGGPLAMIGVYWPLYFEHKPGSRIIVAVRYTYRRGEKIIDSGITSTEIPF